MNTPLPEVITVAGRTASMLLGDIQLAHTRAVYENTAPGDLAAILLLDAIADARKLADRLKQIQDAAGK